MLASAQLKTVKPPMKSQAFLTGRLFCFGVALNFNSFARNCVITFPWPGCFKSMLAYVIHPQNTKNPSFVCERWPYGGALARKARMQSTMGK